MILIDKNQREFDVNVSQLCDMASPLPWVELADEAETRHIAHKVEIVDECGNPVDGISLMDSATSTGERVVIDVTLEATHSGRNHNFFNYDSADLERGAATWKSPFPKPLLKNHDMHVEPLGRVKDYKFGPSILTDERDCITVTFRVTDQDAVAKFLDGRYQTMSIGASSGHITCGLCGKDILKDEEFKFCGHMRGQKYKGEMAYWTAKDFNFKEGSVVNNPADDWAQVIKVQIVKDTQESVQDETVEPTIIEDEVVETVELKDEVVSNDIQLADGEEKIVEEVLSLIEDEVTVEEAEVQDEEITEVVEVEDEVTEVTPTIEDLQSQIDSLNEMVATKDEALASKEEELNDFKARFETSESMIADLKKQNIALATMNKKMLVDAVVMVEAQNDELTDEAQAERREVLSSMKASELSDLLKATKTVPVIKDTPRRTLPPRVKSPGLVDNEKEKNVVDSKESRSDDKEIVAKTATMKDLSDAFVDLFTRQC